MDGSAAAVPLRVRLREATRRAHHELDGHPILAPLVRSGLTLPEYVRALDALNWIYSSIDPLLEAAMLKYAPEAAFRTSPRLRWLREDLKHFGLRVRTSPWKPTAVTSLPVLIGCLYVVEGSTLGGQVVARCVESALGVGPGAGGRFFHGHGTASAEHWGAFIALAERSCTDADAACLAAQSLFQVIRERLDLRYAEYTGVHPQPMADAGARQPE